MGDPLLIRATAALLDGWTGPITVILQCGEVLRGAVDHGRVHLGRTVWENADKPVTYLDLARAECRDRVCRVLFGGPGSPRLDPQLVARRMTLHTEGRAMAVSRRDWEWELEVPALADIPIDDTRLPDGSRRVDALALAAAWRQAVQDG